MLVCPCCFWQLAVALVLPTLCYPSSSDLPYLMEASRFHLWSREPVVARLRMLSSEAPALQRLRERRRTVGRLLLQRGCGMPPCVAAHIVDFLPSARDVYGVIVQG